VGGGSGSFTLKKLGCLKQAETLALNRLAWDNRIRPRSCFVGLAGGVMINRDSRGNSYLIVRGEILRFLKDERQRRHLTRMSPLIKNES